MPSAKAAKDSSLYGVHPSVAMVQKWVSELREKTGRSLEEWIALAKKEGLKDEKSRREWLKSKHKLGTNRASWIAERGRKRLGRHARGVLEGGGPVRGRAVRGSKRKAAADLR